VTGGRGSAGRDGALFVDVDDVVAPWVAGGIVVVVVDEVAPSVVGGTVVVEDEEAPSVVGGTVVVVVEDGATPAGGGPVAGGRSGPGLRLWGGGAEMPQLLRTEVAALVIASA